MSARWLARALGALTLGLIACAVVRALLNRYSLWDVTSLVAQASAALVGGLIASRRPRNPVGWFIIGHALCFTLGESSRQYAIYGLLTEARGDGSWHLERGPRRGGAGDGAAGPRLAVVASRARGGEEPGEPHG